MQTSISYQVTQAHAFPPFPLKLRAGSSEPRPTFLRDEFDTDGMTGHAKAARDHCRWERDYGRTPQEVMISVGRPYHRNSTWGDAARAVESSAYAGDFADVRNKYKEMLKCL